MITQKNDIEWMEIAIKEAKKSAQCGEVPVGAVLVANDNLLAKSGNSPITLNDPTAHAEILVLRKAAQELNNYRLPGTTLYITLEPCIMCVGAILHARVSRVVFGAKDPKTGALVSCYTVGTDGKLNHTLEISAGILEDRCGQLLKDFFSFRRKQRAL